MQKDEPDGKRAWCIAIAACIINFIYAGGLSRGIGVLYVSLMDIYNVNRKTATFPFSLRFSVLNFIGPAVGILGQRYGVRLVSLVGLTISSISIASCFFATDIETITILWGGLFGLGSALSVTLILVVVGQHFKKYRTTASGLACSGGSIGNYVFPALFQWLIKEYGLSGTFLIISGVSLNAIPAAMILRKPLWLKGGKKNLLIHNNEMKERSLSIVSGEGIFCDILDTSTVLWFQKDSDLVVDIVLSVMTNCDNKNLDGKLFEIKKQETLLFLEHIYSVAFNNTENSEHEDSTTISDIIRLQVRKWLEDNEINSCLDNYIVQRNGENIPISKEIVKEVLVEIQNVHMVYLRNQKVSIVDSNLESVNNVDLEKVKLSNVCDNADIPKKSKSQGFKTTMRTIIHLVINPIYILVCLSRTVQFTSMVLLITIMVDFARDKNVPDDCIHYLYGALSLGDLVGRLGFGWITDNSFLSLPKFMVLSVMLLGVTTALIPVASEKWSLSIMIGAYALLQGSLFVRLPIIILKYFRDDETSLAMGFMGVMSGIVGLNLPFIIGYFRDNLGSYNNLFYISGGVSACVGLLWIFEPRISRYNNKLSDKVNQKDDIV